MSQATVDSKSRPGTHLYCAVTGEDGEPLLLHRRVAGRKKGKVLMVGDDGSHHFRDVSKLKDWWPQAHVAVSKAIGLEKYRISGVLSEKRATEEALGLRFDGGLQERLGELETEYRERVLRKNRLKALRREVCADGERTAPDPGEGQRPRTVTRRKEGRTWTRRGARSRSS